MSDQTLKWLEWLVALNGLVIIIQSIRVIATYSAVYSLTKGYRRQLPLHVWMIATSYLIYAVASTYFLLVDSLPSENATSRVLFYGVAGLIGQYALWNVLSYERRKYSAATNFGASDTEE